MKITFGVDKENISIILEGLCLGFSLVTSIAGISISWCTPISIILFLWTLYFEYRRKKKQREENNRYREEAEKAWRRWYREDHFEESENKEEERTWERRSNYFNTPPPQSSLRDAYVFFGIPYGTFDKDQIKSRYRELAFKYHPDRGGNSEQFKLLQKYKEILFNYVGI